MGAGDSKKGSASGDPNLDIGNMTGDLEKALGSMSQSGSSTNSTSVPDAFSLGDMDKKLTDLLDFGSNKTK